MQGQPFLQVKMKIIFYWFNFYVIASDRGRVRQRQRVRERGDERYIHKQQAIIFLSFTPSIYLIMLIMLIFMQLY